MVSFVRDGVFFFINVCRHLFICSVCFSLCLYVCIAFIIYFFRLYFFSCFFLYDGRKVFRSSFISTCVFFLYLTRSLFCFFRSVVISFLLYVFFISLCISLSFDRFRSLVLSPIVYLLCCFVICSLCRYFSLSFVPSLCVPSVFLSLFLSFDFYSFICLFSYVFVL